MGLPAFLDYRRPTAIQFGWLLALLIFAGYYDVALGLKSFVTRDFGICTYPIAFYHRAAFWSGEFPLWNPLSGSGQPFMAQWATLALYPPALIYLFLPMPWSLGIFLLAHLWFAGFGMYRLALRMTGHPLAASIAGLAFAWNGFTFNCLMWPAFLAAIAWMPWVIDGVRQACLKGGRSVAVAAIFGGVQMLAGGPEPILITWILAASLLLLDLIELPNLRTFIAKRFAIITAAVALLAAVQLLPFLDLLSHSQRSAEFADTTWSMPGWGLANFVLPLFRFYRSPQGVFYQSFQDFTSSYYLGIGVLALAIFAIVKLREKRVWLIAGLTLLFLLLALGNHSFFYPWIKKAFPVIGFMRFPMKFVVLPVFAIPLLAAFGFKAVTLEPNKSILPIIGICFAAIITFILWFSHSYPLPNEIWPAVLKSGLTRLMLLILTLLLVYFFNHFNSDAQAPLRKWSALALLAVFALDIATHAPWQNPTVPSAILSPGIVASKISPTPKFGESRAMMTRASHDRIYSSMLSDPSTDYMGRRLGLFANCNLLDGIPTVDGFFPLYLRESREVWAKAFSRSPAPLLNYLGVSQMSDPNRFLEWQPRTNYLPLVTIGQEVAFRSDVDALNAISSAEFRPESVVFLPESDRSLAAHVSSSKSKISEARYRANSVEFRTEAESTTVAVIAQSYDQNWRANIDGKAVPLLRANYGFQAVVVPVGTHQVVLKYVSLKFFVGIGISLATFALCLLALYKLPRVSPSAAPITSG